MVTQAEQEKITYTRQYYRLLFVLLLALTNCFVLIIEKVDFSQLRSDLQTHHSTEYQATRAEYERLSSEIAKLNSRLREEIIRAQNSIKLDLNLEKGRIREEASVQELKIKETDTRIETEVGIIRGTLEAVKFSTLQWLSMSCLILSSSCFVVLTYHCVQSVSVLELQHWYWVYGGCLLNTYSTLMSPGWLR